MRDIKSRNYCTFFDVNYLSYGIVLYNSLVKHSSKPVQLWVLCMDDEAYSILKKTNLDGIIPIALSQLEEFDTELKSKKETRSRIEYYFTCTPCIPRFILELNPTVQDVTYIDADLYFFSDPEFIYTEIGEDSICITPHRFSERVPNKDKWGKYNVAFIYFRRDDNAQSCMDWWRKSCIEWCYDRAEDGKFADQGYLNDWPDRFQGVCVLDNPGINVALWNVEDSEFTLHQKKIFVNGRLLIFYHFHLFKRILPRVFKTNINIYSLEYNQILINKIYQKYANEIFSISKKYESRSLQNSVLRYNDKNGWTNFGGIKVTDLIKQIYRGVVVIVWR